MKPTLESGDSALKFFDNIWKIYENNITLYSKFIENNAVIQAKQNLIKISLPTRKGYFVLRLLFNGRLK